MEDSYLRRKISVMEISSKFISQIFFLKKVR